MTLQMAVISFSVSADFTIKDTNVNWQRRKVTKILLSGKSRAACWVKASVFGVLEKGEQTAA